MISNGFEANLNGYSAEQLAKKFLQSNGLTFVAENFKCKMGEIDLIFKDDHQHWVFVEVKSRKNASFGKAAEFVDKAKKRKIVRAIFIYFRMHSLNSEMTAFRIDVIAINNGKLDWLKNV